MVFYVGDLRVLNDAYVLVNSSAIPENAELVQKISGTSRNFGRPAPILKIMQITACFMLDIRVFGVSDKTVQSLSCKVDMKRHRGRFFMQQRVANRLSSCHILTLKILNLFLAL